MARSRSRTADGRIDINMTPMIDVVFQLLTFFLMTFRVASAEGDFSLLLPNEIGRGPVYFQAHEIVVRVTATSTGELQQIRVDALPGFTGRGAFDRLHREVVRIVTAAQYAGQEPPTVVIDADDLLRYENLLQIIAAVSQQVDEAGNSAPLVKKVRFAPH